MKKFSEYWKEKYKFPPSGHFDEPAHWTLQRVVEAFVDYVDEVVVSNAENKSRTK